ncbi:RING-H2 finger protein [Melia azedarach]|uniref:RING-H2 finger protein n=1 Tax=Melia azedarach TaxID=155640 RepID=A0ACC1XSF5_MELAZ|nr:RING-H2 finger protein [Melia azedarach]
MAHVSRILLTENNNSSSSSSASSKSAAVAAAAPPPEAVALESDFVVILAVLLCALICRCGFDSSCSLRLASPCWLQPLSFTAQQRPQKESASLATLSSDCAICLVEFVEGDELRVLPQCGHGFHVACIDKWLGSHPSCPSCRQILAVERCHKCGQFPAVPSPSTSTSAGGGNNENSCENRSCTATNGASFLP